MLLLAEDPLLLGPEQGQVSVFPIMVGDTASQNNPFSNTLFQSDVFSKEICELSEEYARCPASVCCHSLCTVST